MSKDQRFARWLVLQFVHKTLNMEESLSEFWDAYGKTLKKHGIDRDTVNRYVKDMLDQRPGE